MSEHDDLIIFGSGLDQSIPTDEEFQWVEKEVDQRVQDAIQSGDLDKANRLMRSLIKIAKVAEKQLSRIVYQFYLHWDVFTPNETAEEREQSFKEWADREIGLHTHTIERYIRIGKLLNAAEIDPRVRTELADRNLKELFPIANMWGQGYAPDEKQWEDILIQPDEISIRSKVRDIKGQEPRSTGLSLSIDENGSIWGFKGVNRRYIGSLNLEDPDPIVQQAAERIIRNSGIQK